MLKQLNKSDPISVWYYKYVDFYCFVRFVQFLAKFVAKSYVFVIGISIRIRFSILIFTPIMDSYLLLIRVSDWFMHYR